MSTGAVVVALVGVGVWILVGVVGIALGRASARAERRAQAMNRHPARQSRRYHGDRGAVLPFPTLDGRQNVRMTSENDQK